MIVTTIEVDAEDTVETEAKIVDVTVVATVVETEAQIVDETVVATVVETEAQTVAVTET